MKLALPPALASLCPVFIIALVMLNRGFAISWGRLVTVLLLMLSLPCMLGLALSELSENGPYSRNVKIDGPTTPCTQETLHMCKGEHLASHMATK